MSHNPYALHLARYSTHKQILDAINSGNEVLDVGCNDGYIGAHADKSNMFYGLEYMPESVKAAKKIYKDAIVYDLNKLRPLPWDKQFDVIVFADVLEHVTSAEEVLTFFVQRYLKPGGRVVISLPNIANWKVRSNLLFGRFNYTETGIMDKTHVHFYTFKTARKLVRAAGLRVRSQHGGASLLGVIASLVPPLRALLSTGIILVAERIGDS